MKKILICMLVLLGIFCCAACEIASEDDVINSSGNVNSSDTVSDNSSSKEPDDEPSNDNSDASEDVSDEGNNESIPDESDISEDSSEEPNVPDNSEIDEIITKDIENIKITINGYSELKNNGYSITKGDDTTVSVTVKGYESVLNEMGSGSITASVNVGNMKESGEIELLVTYSAPAGVEIISNSTNFITVTIERKSSEIIAPDVDDVRIVEGVLISGTRAMEQFGGGESGGQKTAAMLNDFKQTMGDVKVYVLPAPLASAFYAPVGYEKSITRHQNCFYGVRDALQDVGFVDTLSALSNHVDEDIYFRTDHHWQALAAYYACEEFARVAGVPFDDISGFRVYSEEGILGSFYTSYTHDAVLKNNPDTMTWYEPTREHTVEYYSRDGHDGTPITGRSLFSTNNGYTKFIYGDSYTTHIKTNVGNGRKLLLFKDSYGNALAPFLVGSFDEIIIADYRYFKTDVSDFITEQGITDVCFELAAFKVNNCNAVDINY